MSKTIRFFAFVTVTASAALTILPQISPTLFAPQRSAPPVATIKPKPAAIDTTPLGAIPSGNSVRTSDSVSQDNMVRVVVHSNQRVTISGEMNARILRMPLHDGERFKAGDELIAFDCARTDAELGAAQAAVNGHKASYEANVQMLRYKAVGSLAVKQARAELEKANADVTNLQAKKQACTITAPFAGRIVEKTAQAFEIVAPNQPLIKIVDDSKPELDLIVPSRWLSWVNSGTKFKVQIDETGEVYQASISQIGGAVDPVSQTVRLMAQIEAPKANILSGMSGTATFIGGDKK